MWLEMSRDEKHGGEGWDFSKYLWSPSHKRNGGQWAFWQSLLQVKQGDEVFHLRGIGKDANFVGYSFADTDGYETFEKPTLSGEWSYASSFFKVPLTGFSQFPDPISLHEVFTNCETELWDYFIDNKQIKGIDHEHLFYVVQANKLQCLNGAYFSNFTWKLQKIIFGSTFSISDIDSIKPYITVRTGQQLSEINRRIGQKQFSDLVRRNFNNQCCFPGCDISDQKFLIGSHIARWADSPELRGDISNGLCFCLLHDKAFEIGLFTISEDLQIIPNYKIINENSWAKKNIIPFDKMLISRSDIKPNLSALKSHRNRVKII